MKYLLIPLTMLLWFLTAYYGLHVAVIGMTWMWSLRWLWLIILYPWLIGLVFGISNGIPSLLRFLILRLYGIGWFSCVVHSLAGLAGVIGLIQLYIADPPQLIVGGEPYFILAGMWEIAPVKTVILSPAIVGILVAVPWSTVIAPIYIKLKYSEEELEDAHLGY